MNTNAGDSFEYCFDYVRRTDEDRWLAAQYAPREQRSRLIALYALHLEIAEIPAKVTEPTLGEIRLQWWREALDEIQAERTPRAHPVVLAAKASGIVDAPFRAAFDPALAARARRLYAEPFSCLEDLVAWLRATESYLPVAAMRALAPDAGDAESLEDAAIAFALARQGAAIAPALAAAGHARALELAQRASPGLRRLSPRAAPAALHFALTRSYVAKRGAALSPTGKRWTLFAAMATGRI